MLISKQWISSDAASGWAGWDLAHPEFGSSVEPIPTKRADYAHHITAFPPGFENLTASLIIKVSHQSNFFRYLSVRYLYRYLVFVKM
jgi:hypothetical protein